MTTSDAGISLITRFEGLALKPYRCPAGYWTIGYGQRITEDRAREMESGITQKQAAEMLRDTLTRFDGYVNSMIERDVLQNVFDALVSFTYNAGPGNVRKSGVVELVNGGKPCMAAVRLSTSCVRGGGKLLRGLVNRRYREALTMCPEAHEIIRTNLLDFYRDNWPDKQPPA